MSLDAYTNTDWRISSIITARNLEYLISTRVESEKCLVLSLCALLASRILTCRYVPVLWYEDQRVMDEASAKTLHEEFLIFVDFALGTAWKGFIASTTLGVFGSILWTIFVVLKIKHDRRVWVD